ncbi:MAG: HD domain-containing protein [Candidatus Pacebacteria bacterium]|nr:HD domain-containing protein [Candidatus Paceibacterota bacterium]
MQKNKPSISSLSNSESTDCNPASLVDELLDLHDRYTFTYRAITTKERYQQLVVSGIIQEFDYDSEQIREPLIEHVGHLPIIASFLHPYLEHSNQVDLGRALTMLSVHDLGETVTGDIFAFDKTEEDELAEQEVVKEMLHPQYHQIYQEFEAHQSFDAKFAKAVDAIAPMIHELHTPSIILDRFEYYNFGLAQIEARKREHFAWDQVLSEVFNEVLGRYPLTKK